MTPRIVSIISTFVNFGLGVIKLIFGFLIGSVALIADGIHSGLDVFSSFVTFLGLKTAEKPVDEKHPYGYWKAENLAGFFVAILLGFSGLWILYEAVMRFFGEKPVRFSIAAIFVVLFTVIITEVLARIKFYYGNKFKSLALVADAEHSRADVISSVGVLLGLVLVNYFNLADAIVALGIGGYILFEAFVVGKEITDSLLDVANKDIEERIRKICQSHNIEISELKTRKIGAFNFAEIKIKLPPKLKVEEVQKLTNLLEERLLANIPELKQIVISIEAYQMLKSIVFPKFGKKIGVLEGFEKIGPEKKGKRVVIPLEEKEINPRFGAEKYLVIDVKDGKILTNKIIKNPYFEENSPHGARFVKAVRADRIFVYQIGENAKQNLNNFGIEVEIIPQNKKIENILEEITKKENQ